MASIAAQGAMGSATLVCLWVLVLMGLPNIKRHPFRRGIAVAILAAGEVDAAYFLFGNDLFREITSSIWSVVLWSAVLVAPMLLGLRYLILLLKPDQKMGE